MKKLNIINRTAGLLLLSAVLKGCSGQFSDAFDAKDIKTMTITIEADMSIEGLPAPEELNVTLQNYTENIKITGTVGSDGTVTVSGIIPGLYNINITGKTEVEGDATYYLNGSVVNYSIVSNAKPLKIPVKAMVAGKLLFKEIYYCGSKYAKGGSNGYFRDQFYELYNNTEKVIYLDKIYFADLAPTVATAKLPMWPKEDGNNYVYATNIWQFPGRGTDYPLKSGESCVISQFATNHKVEKYNLNSPMDCSSSEFEFNCHNANFPDQPATDMTFIYANGTASNTLLQYMVTIFGGAYALFQVPDGVTYDPVKDKSLNTTDLASTSTKLYAKIPIDYVIDAVEAGQNESMIVGKRVPGLLDSGMTYVGQTFIGVGVARKVKETRANGDLVFEDTNNSTDDFERGLVPQFRRYNTKMPSWNHTLLKK
nr:DUF4876 domain-containing protein [uncultured Bacteroides sp.]